MILDMAKMHPLNYPASELKWLGILIAGEQKVHLRRTTRLKATIIG